MPIIKENPQHACSIFERLKNVPGITWEQPVTIVKPSLTSPIHKVRTLMVCAPNNSIYNTDLLENKFTELKAHWKGEKVWDFYGDLYDRRGLHLGQIFSDYPIAQVKIGLTQDTRAPEGGIYDTTGYSALIQAVTAQPSLPAEGQVHIIMCPDMLIAKVLLLTKLSPSSLQILQPETANYRLDWHGIEERLTFRDLETIHKIVEKKGQGGLEEGLQCLDQQIGITTGSIKPIYL